MGVGTGEARAPAELEVAEADTGEGVRTVLLSFKATVEITQVVNEAVCSWLFILKEKSNHRSRAQLLSYNSQRSDTHQIWLLLCGKVYGSKAAITERERWGCIKEKNTVSAVTHTHLNLQ